MFELVNINGNELTGRDVERRASLAGWQGRRNGGGALYVLSHN